MWRTAEGSSGRLVQLCLGYFAFYVITGVSVKFFLGSADKGMPGMSGIEYLVYSTASANLVCIAVVLALGWYRFKSSRSVRFAGMNVPQEFAYIIPSGICTAVVIPTTTLMYTLPISVMVAMVIMRGSVIVISRAVDAIQIRQGLLKKKVYLEENIAVLFALTGVSVHLLFVSEGGFDFFGNVTAIVVLSSYVAAYALRIYIMNYFKNTRPKGAEGDNRGFFAIEQIASSIALVSVFVSILAVAEQPGLGGPWIDSFQRSLREPHPGWLAAGLSGTAFGFVAFFSVFIFMFKGRTATFAGLVNRLTSLVAGTVATLLFWLSFGGKAPAAEDWYSLGFIFLAVFFLTRAEKKRAGERSSLHVAAAQPLGGASPAQSVLKGEI